MGDDADTKTSDRQLLIQILNRYRTKKRNPFPQRNSHDLCKPQNRSTVSHAVEIHSFSAGRNRREPQKKDLTQANTVAGKLKSNKSERRRRFKNKSENYGTINLKDLLAKGNVTKAENINTNVARDKTELLSTRRRCIQKSTTILEESTLPVDPDHELKQQREIFDFDYSEYDDLLNHEIDEAEVQRFFDELFQKLKATSNFVKYRKYFEIIDSTRYELESDYKDTVKKAFFEVTLSNAAYRDVLHVKVFKTAYAVFQVRFPVSWHQNVINGKNFMRHNLFIIDSTLVQLRDLWFEKYENTRVIDINVLHENDLCLDLHALNDIVEKMCDQSRQLLLQKWLPECSTLIRSQKSTFFTSSSETKQVQKFFAAVHALMSLQIRRFVTNSMHDLLTFILTYKDGNKITDVRQKFVFLREPLMTVNLRPKQERPYYCFSPSFDEIINDIQNLFKRIMAVGDNIPRLEKLLFSDWTRTDQYLLPVRVTENHIQNMLAQTYDCCLANFCGPQSYVTFYSPYYAFFEEKTANDLRGIINRRPLPPMKVFVEKMEEFISLKKTINKFCVDVSLNMINLRCNEFNDVLCNRIDQLCTLIINYFLDESRVHNERIISKFEEIARKSSENPDSTKALIELNNFIYESKTVILFSSKKELAKSAEYMEFLLCYTDVPENIISINSKIFRWPKHLERILELAASRISHRIETVENHLKLKISKFNATLVERSKELDNIKRKDPPLLTLNEMTEMVSCIDQFTLVLEEDKIQAQEINAEEELLNLSVTSYHILDEIVSNLKPFSELWHTVLNFHESNQVWCNSPFVNLDADEVKKSAYEMKNTLGRLSKAFVDISGARRIVEIVLTKVEKFCSTIPVLETICNPGLQDRHWQKIDELVGAKIKRTPETSFAEILNYGFNKCLPTLREINISATEEHLLERNLQKMKNEWNGISIQHEIYRDSCMPVLMGIDDIQVLLDDYLMRIQTMRGSPYIGAIESDVEAWEDKLITMQDILDLWLQVQSTWLYLEPLFGSEDIMRQMPEESERFNEINKTWNDIMNYAIKNSQILLVIEYPNLMNILKECNVILEGIKKQLNEYLEKKRLIFPRFFFLSNRELLETLSENKNFSKVQSHLKCFEGIASLEMTENFDITGIISKRGEIVPLNNAVSPVEAKGIVERWLDQLEDSMIQSLCDINNKAVRSYSQTSTVEWIFQWPTMISYCALYISWTNETENAIREGKLRDQVIKYETILKDVIGICNNKMPLKDRYTVSVLISLLIYLLDITVSLKQKNISNPDNIHWIKRLRYYNEEQSTTVRILRTNMAYGYEYLGDFNRLIITPETERCYRFMATSMDQFSFSCLTGVARTGKSQICKDFSKAVAKPFCNFKCCRTVGYKTISTFLKGCVQMGAWVCFDAVDIMKCEELSVVAEEIRSVHAAIKRKANRLKFGNVEIPLNTSCNIMFIASKINNFKTLPDTLRITLRPIVVSKQDWHCIVKNSLISYGFDNSSRLTEQILQIHNLSNELTTFKHYYKSDLQTLKKVLEHARMIKFDSEESKNEFEIIGKAVRLVYTPQFTREDLNQFEDMWENTFEDSVGKEKEQSPNLDKQIEELLLSQNLVPTDTYVKKIFELHERLLLRQNVIALGKSFSGKTKALHIVAELLKSSSKGENVKISVINPKSVTEDQLYGQLDLKSGEWTDGIFSRIYRESVNISEKMRKWIILDGLMDHEWTERLITVFDENRELCLVNGEIIPINDETNVIFETDSLDYVSPAIFHCCTIVLFETGTIGWQSIYKSFINDMKNKFLPDQIETIQNLTEWIVPAVLNYLKEYTDLLTLLSENYLFQCFTRVMICMLNIGNNGPGISNLWLQSVLLFSVVWGFAGCIPENSKILFDTFYRKLLSDQNEEHPLPEKLKMTKQLLFPEKNTVFDWICKKQSAETWIPWAEIVDNGTFSYKQEMYTYTSDNIYQLYFLKLLLESQNPALIVGPQGSGKTATLLRHFSTISCDKFVVNIINLTAFTSANRVQEKIMSKIDRRRKGVYGPAMGKKIILAFDDFEMSLGRGYTTQNIVELMRQLIEYQFWYDLEKICRTDLIDFIFAGAMTSDTNDFSKLSPRFIHHINIIPSKTFNKENVSTIFTANVDWYFTNRGFASQLCRLNQALVSATLDVYDKMKIVARRRWERLPPYYIDLKDVSRVFSGIGLMSGQECQGADELYRLWFHEIMRVFGDKVQSDVERDELFHVIKSSSTHYLRQRIEQYMGHLIMGDRNILQVQDLRNLCFANFSNQENGYDEVPNISTLTEHVRNFVSEQQTKCGTPISCIIFKHVIESVSIITRAFRKDGGHLLLIGPTGNGRQTVLKLAALISKFSVFELEFSSKYNIENWHDDLKQRLIKCGVENESQLLIISADRISHDEFLDDINALLCSGDLSDIFTDDEKSNILNKMMEMAHEEGVKFDTAPFNLYNLFVQNIKKNLHIAITMNPLEDTFYYRLHTCPAFLKCCTVYWLNAWPKDALENIAEELLKNTPVFKDAKLLETCVAFCEQIHEDVTKKVTEYRDLFGTKLSITPEIFIKFVRTFETLYRNKIEEISAKKNRYKQGLEKLNSTANQVTLMQSELQILKPKLLDTSESTEKLMVKIEQKTMHIEAAKEIVAADEALANEAAAASQAIRDDCESDLSEAEPALVSATNALNTLKCSDITVIKAMKNPPSIVKLVLEAVCVMKGMKPEYRTEVSGLATEDYWPTCLKLLSDAKFLDNLKSYDKENIDPNIMSVIRDRFITHPDFDPNVVKKVSNACEGLCKWVRAMEIYDRVIKIVRPKKIKLAKAEEDYAAQMEKLNEKRTQLTEVMSKLQVLRDELAEKTKQKKELEDSVEICTLKLERAGKLLESLRYEKLRWQQLETKLNEDLRRSVGDIFLSSAFITYLAIFPADHRHKMVQTWYQLGVEMQLPITKNYSFSSIFVNADEIRFWSMAGLPTDPTSIDNFTIIFQTIYTPFVIDPQDQVKNFIMYKEENVQVLRIIDETFVSDLEKSIEKEVPILIEEAPAEVDDILLSLINPKIFEIEGTTYFKMGGKNIRCQKLPKMYITTRHNAAFNPTIFNKVTLINFEMTAEELENRLLKIIISVDAPQLEEKNNNLLLKCAEDCRSLYQTEDKILDVLSITNRNILEDETALQTLNDSKNLLEQVREKQKRSLAAEEKLKSAYDPYKIISKKTTRIFFAISKLRFLNPFYRFSFDSFITLFHQAVEKSEKSDNMDERIHFVNDYFTSNLYEELCRILDEKHLMAACFSIAIEMKSDTSVDLNALSNGFWHNRTLILKQLFIDKFSWTIPPNFHQKKLTEFEDTFSDYNLAKFELNILFKNLETRTIIPSTLAVHLGAPEFITCVKDFIAKEFKTNSESSLNLYEVQQNTEDRIPIICGFVDEDVDPLTNIYNLASEMGYPEEVVKCIPFTKTQLPLPFDTIFNSLEKGEWIVIQNCHLLKDATQHLDFLFSHICNARNVHTEFRLWITTVPFEQFSATILTKGTKIMLKEARQLPSILHHLYTYSSVDVLQILEKNRSLKNWNFFYFLICFCHAVIKILFNSEAFHSGMSCNITKLNVQINTSLVEVLYKGSETAFEEGLGYLMNEANYSAHLADTKDKIILSAIIDSVKVESITKPERIQILNFDFDISTDLSFNSCLRFIQSIPEIDLLNNFKMHYHTAIKNIRSLVDFWRLIRTYSLGSKSKVDEKILKIIMDDIFAAITHLPKSLRRRISSPKDVLNIFLKQEILLYDKLVETILNSLKFLKEIILGRFPASPDMEIMSLQLRNNEIPIRWNAFSYPNSQSLSSYIFSLSQRLTFLNKWIQNGLPNVIWLPGIFNVSALFEAIKYNFSRYNRIPLLKVVLRCHVTKYNADAIFTDEWSSIYKRQKLKSTFGVFVYGLSLVGCYWDSEAMTITDSTSEKFFSTLPILWIEPQEKTSMDDTNVYNCPLYYSNNAKLQPDFMLDNYIADIALPSSISSTRLHQNGAKLIVLPE